PGIDETDCYPEDEIRFTERLLYDNSSPCPPKEFVFENSNADIESFSPSPIPVEDSDSRMEEIDLSFNSDDPMPPSIEEYDDDSERDILIHEELLDNYSLSLPENESFHFDIPSFSRPPANHQMEGIAMDFVTKLPKTSGGHDTIWVIVDRLTKSDRDSRFTSRFWQSMQEALRTHLDMSTAFHPQTDDRDSRFTSRFWQSMQEALRTYLDMSTAFHPQTDGQRPELVQETTEKISQIKDRLKAARDRQKSYAHKWRKPLKFSVGDYVLLKASPWKDVVCFGKKGKLAPRFVGPFKIVEKVGLVAYRLDLPEELNGVHVMFRVSNLKKYLADPI
nr:hypothetical protein [Tanacetum cinerariifolium]